MKQFPAWQDLSKEQDRAVNLPLDGSYLVIGPPGTGKTVVALWRGGMLQKRGDEMFLVTRMRMLREYTSAVLEQFDITGSVKTFHSWFYAFYKTLTGKNVPQHGPYDVDWPAVLRGLGSAKKFPEALPNVLIDEGQDLPRDFYGLARIMSRNLTIFADENQRLHGEQSSTLNEIQANAAIENVDVIHLTRNYRNTAPIARLAAAFYCGLRTGIPDIPTRDGDRPEVRKFDSFEAEMSSILRYERLNVDLQIGILVPNNNLLNRVVDELTGRTKNRVRFYTSKERSSGPIAFGEPGIIVLNYASAKGLEFDTVFLPQIQKASKLGRHDEPDFKMTMYVMISRARDRLFVSFMGTKPALLDAFPSELCDWKV